MGSPRARRTFLVAALGAGLFAIAALVARRTGLARLARGVAAGTGVVAAYLASEGIKVLVAQLRPCRNFAVSTISACPDAADWAWPSNHATIAVALAVAVVIMAPRMSLLAAPIAAAIAASRVVVGVHDVHDVAAGALLAVLVVLMLVRFGARPIERGMIRVARRWPGAAVALGARRPNGPRRRVASSRTSTAAA